MITWELTTDLIADTFEISLQELAGFISLKKDAMSKLRAGTLKASPDFNTIFHGVFDPDNEKSPAHRTGDTINGLLETLKDVIEQPKYQEIRKAMDELWDTSDYERFIRVLIWKTRCATNSPSKKTDESNPIDAKPPSEQLHEIFLKSVSEYQIMEIINKKPAHLYWNDSADLNNFLKLIDKMLFTFEFCDHRLRDSIAIFGERLHHWALVLEAGLNNRYGFNPDDETAYIDMEYNNEDLPADNEIKNRLNLPELSLELIEDADDKIHLMELYNDSWGSFRNEMNRLHQQISSWSDESVRKQ